jgi:hypothetical protein
MLCVEIKVTCALVVFAELFEQVSMGYGFGDGIAHVRSAEVIMLSVAFVARSSIALASERFRHM